MLQRVTPWKAGRGRARADASDLLIEHGDLASGVARHLARAERLGKPMRPALRRGHWTRVLREVERLRRRPDNRPPVAQAQ